MEQSELLQKKSVILMLTVSGMRQRHEFFIEREETSYGKVPFLMCKRNISLNELMKVAEENRLPVKCAGQKIFPKGKSPKDFAGL